MMGMLSLLIHEAGHIIAARLSSACNICLKIGAGKKLFAFRIGRLHVIIHRLFFLQFVTESESAKQYTNSEKIFISFLGPLFSIFFAGICYFLFTAFWDLHVLFFSFLFNLWVAVINLLPFKIGKKSSDGYVIFRLLNR